MFRLTLATRLALSMSLLATGAAAAKATDNAPLTQRKDPYFLQAQAQLQQRLKQTPNTNRAKNVILVVGDGMGFSTVTAARIFEGQQRGVDGESNVLAWEAFPYLAAAKTYSADAQITDSAPSAVAMTTGVKTINDLMGLNHTAALNNCEDQQTKAVTTLWEMAATLGMSTGAVTTATITHATPGATYAHIANRDWESDAKMPADALAAGCRDIARQLVEMKYGNGLNVAMGGAVALNEAVKTIVGKVNLDETLVIVTGDHSHTLTIAGYAKRGNPILGISVGVDGKPRLGSDGKPYTTLGFANGPGGAIPLTERPALTMEQTTAPDFIQPALVPLKSETHGGEDLGIYAIGPWAHLFQGTVEENYTFHVMNYASRISERLSER